MELGDLEPSPPCVAQEHNPGRWAVGLKVTHREGVAALDSGECK